MAKDNKLAQECALLKTVMAGQRKQEHATSTSAMVRDAFPFLHEACSKLSDCAFKAANQVKGDTNERKKEEMRAKKVSCLAIKENFFFILIQVTLVNLRRICRRVSDCYHPIKIEHEHFRLLWMGPKVGLKIEVLLLILTHFI